MYAWLCVYIASAPTGSTTKRYAYDAYSCVSEQIISSGSTKILTTSYTYRTLTNSTTTATTGQVHELTIDGTMADTLGVLNPIRYRSYVYDQETTLYYLQSRYYDPEVGRFINADAFASTGQGLLGNNMFAYCLNNPVKYGDYSGYDAVILYDEDFLGHIGVLVQDESGHWWHFYWGTNGILNRVRCAVGFFVPVYTWCVEYEGDVNLDSINKAEEYSGDYEKMYYLEGDFTESLDEFKDASGLYHLYFNNCSEETLRTLAKSDTKYARMLRRASRKIIPANAAQEIEIYFILLDTCDEYFSE